MTYKSEYLQILSERGFIHSLTDETGLDEKMQQESITAYVGFDCTAPSLHVGSLVQIMMLSWLQKTGHRALVIMGGGTTKVGDPSGKDESRKILTEEIIAENMAGIKKIFEPFLTFGNGKNDAIMVNNDEWLSSLNYIEFLRDYGKHFSVNRMMSFDSVKLRLDREQNLSFLEFNYMILQAYDFLELNRRYDCSLQMGGSDQWGNIINGIELTRRCDEKQVFGLTTPLLTTSTGAKMGKTAAGAVWLNRELLPDWDYWQFWRNTSDADVIKFLKLFTFLSLDEINKLAKLEGAELNEAKKILATEATALARGREAALECEATAMRAFEQGGTQGLPTMDIPANDLKNGIAIIDLLALLELAPSKSEARRLITGGGVKINDEVVSIEKILLESDKKDDILKISVGKKKHYLLKTV